ncbi:MAG: discoidin domain-containing protein, partial [Clostridiales bacterium]|nr:discoidin domain-containing protein [Clostridiales bacterium]
ALPAFSASPQANTVSIAADKTAQWTYQERSDAYDLRIHGWTAWETAAYIGFTLPAGFDPASVISATLQLYTYQRTASGTAYLYAATYGAFANGSQYEGSSEVPAYDAAQFAQFTMPSASSTSSHDVTAYIKALAAGSENAAVRIDAKSANLNHNWRIGSCTNSYATPILLLELADGEPVTFGASADGSAAAATTAITVSFDVPVAGLTANSFALNPAGAATKGTPATTDGGMTWTLPVSNVRAGNATVSVSAAGFQFSPSAAGANAVALYAEPVTYSVAANGSAAVTSTEIAISFDKPLIGLTLDDITLSPASMAAKAGLSASPDGKAWTLGISNVAAGDVAVAVADIAGFTFSHDGDGNKTTLFVKPAEAVKYSAAANGDAQATTTAITLAFDKPVTGLTIGAITLTPANASKIGLAASSDNMAWTLAVSRVTAGEVAVAIADSASFAFSFDGDNNMTTLFRNAEDPGLADTAVRQEVDFDGGWKYNRGDAAGAEQPDFGDAAWESVSLPHSTDYVMYDSIEAYLGICWYRKAFVLPENLADKQIFINFGAAMQLATVYVNGTQVGEHQSGFMGFTYDITDSLDAGGQNVIAVKLDTRANTNWLPGAAAIDFRYHGGLYRSVKLVVNEKVHLTDPLLKPASPTEQVIKPASGGVFIHSDTATVYADASADCGITNIQGNSSTGFTGDVTFWIGADVKNETEAAVSATVTNELFDPSGASVWRQTTNPVSIPPAASLGDSVQIADTGSIAGAKLWHPNFPHLYTLVTRVYASGELVDELATRTGFKRIVFTNASGSATSGTKGQVLINGEAWVGLGTNTHQEIGMVGFAVPEAAARDEVRMIKDAGYDIVRLAHYPYQRAFIEACDEYGVMVQQPITGWQNGGASNAGRQQSAYREAQDMMRRDRNSPSVVVWEFAANEGGSNTNIAPTITANAKLEIPTKNMWTQGGTTTSYYDIMAVHSTNSGQGAFKNNAPNIYNEFGDWDGGQYASSTRQPRWRATEAPVRQALANYQTALDRSQGSTVNFGYYWVWQDYTGFGEGNPDTPNTGSAVAGRPTPCGIVDFFRVPKYAYYYAQAQRSPSWTYGGPEGIRSGPMIYIANRWFDDSETLAATDVMVYGNADSIRLFGSLDGGRTYEQIGADKTAPDALKIPEIYYGRGYDPANVTGNFSQTPWKNTDYKPWTFSGVNHAYTAIKAEGYSSGGQKISEYVVKDPRTLTPSKVDLTWWADWNSDGMATAESREAPLIANGGDKRLLYIDIEDAEGNVIANSGTAPTALSFGAPTDNAHPVTVTVTSGDAWILGGETANAAGAKSATITPRGGQVAVWVVAGTTPDDTITVTATAAELEPGSASIDTVAPVGFLDGQVVEPPVGPSDDTCLAYKKPASASSGAAALANDGDDETVWAAGSGNAGEYWQANLQAKYDISKISILWGAESAYKYWIQYSADGQIWLPLSDKTASAAPELETAIEFAGKLKSAQFVKVLLAEDSADSFAIAEIHVEGAASSEIAEKDRADGKPAYSGDLAEGSVAAWGNDGVPTSFATMRDSGAGNKWWVDMQGFFDVTGINIMWFETAAHKYKLEASKDGLTWQTILYRNRNADAPVEYSTDSFSPPLAGVRFIRITSVADAIPMSFTQLSVFGNDANDLALAKPVESDAVTDAAHQPLYAVDRDADTAWVPDAPGRYIQVDIGSVCDIHGVSLVWPDSGAHEYSLLASGDGLSWQKYFDGATSGESDIFSAHIAKARYVRLVDKTGSGLASFEVFGSPPAETAAAAPGANLLKNRSFEDNAGLDIMSWPKLQATDASAAQSTTSGSGALPEYNVTHGTGDRYAYLYSASPYSASIYQTVTGIPNGIYEFRGWVKRGNPDAGAEQAELYAYAENYGGETIVNNLLETVPRTAATYAQNTGNTAPGQYPYTEVAIGDIHVTNGQITIGFFANSPNNASASPNYAFIDDLSLKLILADPEYPSGDDDFNGYIDIGRSGGDVVADFRVAANGASGSLLAIIAAYNANGTLVHMNSDVLSFADGRLASGRLAISGYSENYSYAAYLWDALTYIPVMGKETLSVKSVEPIMAFPLATDGYTLPETVAVRYNDSPNGLWSLPVAWDGDAGPFSKIGEYAITGTVEGTDVPAVAYVTVKGPNLLSNPSLDAWSASNGAPADWVRSSSASNRFSRDAGAKNQHAAGSGAHYSAGYYLSGAAAGTPVALYQTLSLQPGKYALSCYTQGLIIPGSTGDIRLYHSTGTTAPTGQSDPIAEYGGVSDWLNPTYTFSVDTAGNISVGAICSLNNGTWLHVDDFELSKIG